MVHIHVEKYGFILHVLLIQYMILNLSTKTKFCGFNSYQFNNNIQLSPKKKKIFNNSNQNFRGQR